MKSHITNEPADTTTRYRTSSNIGLLSNNIYLCPDDSHRNKSCSCGSGKKYKRCCGKKPKETAKP